MAIDVAFSLAQLVLLFFASVVLVPAQSTASTVPACVPSPKSVAIRNVSIANSPNSAVARGIAISIGTPAQDFAFMPFDYFETFANHTNFATYFDMEGANTERSFGLNFFDLMYLPVDSRFGGHFQITFQDGPTVTISNDQFVVPHIYADDTSGLWSQTFSEYDLLINSGSLGASDGILGLKRHASTFIYTMVNLDAGEFTIWAANKESNSESLVAVDSNNVAVDQTSLCASTSSPTVSSSAVPTATKSSALSGGTIAGIAIGAVAAVALLGLLGWWILRRKRQQVQAQPHPSHLQDHHPPEDDMNKFHVPGDMGSPGRSTLLSDFDASGTARTVSTTPSHPASSFMSELPVEREQQGARFELLA